MDSGSNLEQTNQGRQLQTTNERSPEEYREETSTDGACGDVPPPYPGESGSNLEQTYQGRQLQTTNERSPEEYQEGTSTEGACGDVPPPYPGESTPARACQSGYSASTGDIEHLQPPSYEEAIRQQSPRGQSTSGEADNFGLCTCLKSDIDKLVAGYCPACVEFYCQDCLRVHLRSKLTERHRIVQGSDLPSFQSDKPVKYHSCKKHVGMVKDKYCYVHNIIICGKCVIGEHYHCEVKPVLEACKSYNISNEEKTLNTQVNKFFNYTKTAMQSLEENINKLKHQKQIILKDATDYRDRIVTQMQKQFDKFCKEVIESFNVQYTILSNNSSEVQHIASDIEGIVLNDLESTQNDPTRFIECLSRAEQIRLCEDRLKSLKLTAIDAKYVLNKRVQTTIESNSRMGAISFQLSNFRCDSPFPYIHYPVLFRIMTESLRESDDITFPANMTQLDKINVKTADDAEDCSISGVDVTADGNYLIVDFDNCKVKMFSPVGQLLSHLKLAEKPGDIAVINNSEAAVCLTVPKLCIIDINTGKQCQLALKQFIDLKYYVWGIAAYKNNLIISCNKSTDAPRSVQMIDRKGKTLWTVTFDSLGNSLFDYARFLRICAGTERDAVVVSDWDKQTITILDAHSGKVVKVCDLKGHKPRGVAIAEAGHIFVCYSSGEISIWSNYMTTERCVIPKSKGVKSAHSIVYHRRRKELLVTSNSSDTVYCDFVHRYMNH